MLFSFFDDVKNSFYVRVSMHDKVGVLKDLGEIMARNEANVKFIDQYDVSGAEAHGDFIIDPVLEKSMKKIISEIKALDSIKVNNYDLILVDINIPGISGMEITQYVRTEMYLDTPIIIFTSSNVEQTEIDCFDIGADEFIAKPISPLVLITRINNLLKKKRAKIQYNLN